MIESWIQVLITPTPSVRQHSAAMWMWCGTCVNCLVIEACIQVLVLPVSVRSADLLSRLADWQCELLLVTIPRYLGGRILQIVAYS